MKRRFIEALSALLALTFLLCACSGGGAVSKASQDSSTEGADSMTTDTNTQENELMIELEDIVNLTAADIRNMETVSGKKAAVSIDIVCELFNEPLTAAKIRGTFTSIKNLGISRVYLIMCSPSYPLMAGGGIAAVKTGVTKSNIEKSLENLGEDPNKVYIETCHALGLEAIAVIKPYEGGGGATIPEGKSVADITSSYASSVTLDTVGGERVWFDSFISEHPEMRVQRKSGTGQNISAKVKTIEILYYPTGSMPSMSTLNSESKNAPNLWVSSDNGSYTLYENITYNYDTVSNYRITDANGEYVMKKNCIRLTVTVNGEQNYPYFAVTLKDGNYLMSNAYSRPYSMTALYDASGNEIASTLGFYVRKPSSTSGTHVWGTEATPASPKTLKGINVSASKTPVGVYESGTAFTGAENFHKYGFEYEYVYTSEVQNGFISPIIALAVGKNEYVQGLLCEGYEEVREYWLSQVRSALDYGADGIDIRYDGHSAMVSDFYYYGYNAPIAEAYLAKYGASLESAPVNATTARRVMEIRGEFFLKFLEKASELAHEKGAIFMNHIFATGYTEYLSNLASYIPDGSSNCFAQWKMPKIIIADYKKLIDISDEIIYKDYFDAYFVSSSQKQGKALTDYANEKGKKVWIHCYVQQSPKNLNDKYMQNFASSYAYGTTLYEITPSFDYGTAGEMLKKYVVGEFDWSISVVGRISGIKKGTTAGELISLMGMIGENVVVDKDGRSVSLDTELTDDMRLCLNRDTFYTLLLK